MSYQKHIIKRQLLEFQIPSAADSFALQQEMAAIYTSDILPLIDAYLSAFSAPGTIDTIDVLELDLGRIDRSNLRASFVEQVEIQLQEQLGMLAEEERRAFDRSPELLLSIQQPEASPGHSLHDPRQPVTIVFGSDDDTDEPGETPASETAVTRSSNPTQPNPDLREPVTIVFGNDDDNNDDEPAETLASETAVIQPSRPAQQNTDLRQPVTLVFGEDSDAETIPSSETAASATGSAIETHSSSEPASGSRPASTTTTAGLRSGKRSREEADSELLAHYFQTGTFPWWAESNDRAALEQTLLRMLKEHVPLIRQLLADLLVDPVARQRFIYTFSDAILQRVIKACVPERSTAINRLRSEWKAFVQQEDAALRLVFWMDVVQAALTETRQPGHAPRKLLTVIQARMTETTALPPGTAAILPVYKATIQLLTKVTAVFALPELKQLLKSTRQSLKKNRDTSKDRKLQSTEERQAFAQLSQELAAIVGRAGALERPVQARRPTVSAFSDSDNIPVNNAGLVILWPFLSTFFDRMGLLTEQRWTDRAAAEKACCMLQYLANGLRLQPLEAQLPLNKILCGLPFDEPLNTLIKLTEEDLELGEELLHAVIRLVPDWKNLTADGLRGSYLMREGLLSTRDGSWLLQVKRVPYDILTDRISWNFRHVRLPWMNTLLAVVW